MSVTLALFSAASAAFMPLPNTQLPVSARSVVRMDGGGLSRFPKLPTPVTDVLKVSGPGILPLAHCMAARA